MSKLYVQTPTYYLQGSGVIVGATSAVINSLVDIYGNVLTLASFGDTIYLTFEPDTNNEEAAIATGITANANGTYTFTGLQTILAQSPYTATSGLIRQHSGGTKIVVTDNVAFWATFANKNNNEQINGLWNFTQTPTGINPDGVPDSSTTVKGIGKVSVAPVSSTSPIFIGQNDPILTTGAGLTTNSGTALNGTSNKIEDTSDTATVATANKVVRANGSGIIDASFLTAATASQVTTIQTASTAITVGQPLTAWYYQSDGGIKLDTNGKGNSSSGTSVSQSVTIGNNTNRVFYVNIVISTAAITSITFGGSAMSLLTSQLTTSGSTQYVYYIVAPATGAQTLAINWSSTQVYAYTYGSYYNVVQTAPEANGKTTNYSGGGGSVTNTLSTIANGALMIAFAATSASNSPFGGVSGITNATNNTLNSNSGNSNTLAAGQGDSGIIFPGAISVASTATFTGSGTILGSIVQVSLAPITVPVEAVTPSSSASAALGQNKYGAFIGFASSSVSAGASVTIITNGISAQSGLTPNSQYYLNDTIGTIGTSAGTNTRKVGISLSATQLSVTNIW